MRILTALAMGVALAGVAAAAVTVQETFSAKVTGVESGDVITVERNGESQAVVLYGVDAPEAGQDYADNAQEFVKEKALDKLVTVQVIVHDAQDRPVAKVGLPGGASLNNELLRNGLAWWDENRAPKAKTYKKLNAEAIIGEKGIWSQTTTLAPWDYRRSEGIEEPAYTTEKEKSKPPPARAESDEDKDKPKVLKAKGDSVYKGNFVDLGQMDLGSAGKIDPSSLITRHQPHIATGDDGKPLGLTAREISKLPFASQMGFQDGDIITSINGQKITSLPQLGQMVQNYAGNRPDSLRVEVLRNGKPQTMTLRLP